MAHGILHGIKHGIVHGAKQAGQLTLGGDPFAGIDRDATSNIYYPANSSQWTQFRSAASLSIGNPNSLWLCQEASGNLADSIGSLTLTATGSPAYNQAVAGHTRLGLTVGTDGAADRFAAAAGVGPSPATTSQVWLFGCLFPATPAAVRTVGGLNITSGTNSFRVMHLNATGFVRNQVVSVNTDGANSCSTEFHLIVMRYDRANSVGNVYTKDEKLVGTYSASVNDGAKGILNGSLTKVVYIAMWSGANAENFTDGNTKSLVQAMGTPVGWS